MKHVDTVSGMLVMKCDVCYCYILSVVVLVFP